MVSTGRFLATLVGAAIGAWEGVMATAWVAQIPLVKQTPVWVLILAGALWYGALGFKYGEFGVGFAVAVLVLDQFFPVESIARILLVLFLIYIMPVILILWGGRLPLPQPRILY